jgi:hypothetical protein
MILLNTTPDTKIIAQALESENPTLLIIAIIGIVIIPNIFNYLVEKKRASKVNLILTKIDQVITEQKDVNKHFLGFLNKNTATETLSPTQLSSILEEFLQSGKQKIIEEVRQTIIMNNLKNKEMVTSKVNDFCKGILTDTFDKMYWFEYKGLKIGNLIKVEWSETVAIKVIEFIYDNKYVFDEDHNKIKYYDFAILNRNLDLTFIAFTNEFNKKTSTLKSDLEKKINSYDYDNH